MTRNGRIITRSGYGKLNVAIVVDSNYIDNTVTNGIPYFYVVTAVDNNGHESGNSNEAAAKNTALHGIRTASGAVQYWPT